MWNCRLLGLQEKAAQSHVAGAWAGSPNPTPKENEASSPELLLLLLSFFAFLFSPGVFALLAPRKLARDTDSDC